MVSKRVSTFNITNSDKIDSLDHYCFRIHIAYNFFPKNVASKFTIFSVWHFTSDCHILIVTLTFLKKSF